MGWLWFCPNLWAQASEFRVDPGDTAWVLTASALVMIMIPGLAFFYGGMVRNKNVTAMVFQTFVCLGTISLVWFAVGYTLAFGPDTKGGLFGDMSYAFMNGVTNDPIEIAPTIPHSVFMIFQAMFAIITPALIVGAFAERMKFKACLIFLIFWSILVYSPVAHWIWGGGFLATMWEPMDFAGGMVVHMTSGFSALVAAIVIGPRRDYGKVETKSSNVPLICIGTTMLWFGWYGFNAGSALEASETAGNAFVTTHFATATALVVWMLCDWFKNGKPNLTGVCVACVVGLIAITPAAGFVSFKGAVLIGAVASVVSYIFIQLINSFKIDDTLGVFACHGMAGWVGTLMTGLLAVDVGGLDQFVKQLKSSSVVLVYCVVVSFILLKVIDIFIGLRPTEEEEATGMDLTDHDEPAYT